MKELVKRCLRKCGYELRRLPVSNQENTEYVWEEVGNSWNTDILSHLHINPKTIVDVGVAGGTPALYAAFPQAHCLLIEPVSAFNSLIEKNMRKQTNSYQVVNVAAGEKPGQAIINIDRTHPLQSKTEFNSTTPSGDRQVQVAVDTVSNIVNDCNGHAPYLIKIDVEGAELDVLKGCIPLLKHSVMIIVEVAISRDDAYRNNVLMRIDQIVHSHGFILNGLLDALVYGPRSSRDVQKADFVFINAAYIQE